MKTMTGFLCLAAFLTSCTTQTNRMDTSGTPTHTEQAAETATSEPSKTPTRIPPSTTPTEKPPTPTPAPPLFSFVGEDVTAPVVGRGEDGAWDDQYINPGATFYTSGQFHMFRNAFFAFPGVMQVGYSVSKDGIVWREPQEEPVFSNEDIPLFGSESMMVSSGHLRQDGTWVLYYFTYDGWETPAVIGRLTAPTPFGPWEGDEQPVLTGDEGGWDAHAVIWPRVIETENELVMFFVGGTEEGVFRLGMATSQDGMTWNKYDDPATTDGLYAFSDPVFIHDERTHNLNASRLTAINILRPAVAYSPEGFVLQFQSNGINERSFARSQDGITWQNYPSNPVFDSGDYPKPASIFFANLLYVQDTYYFFTEHGGRYGTDIYLATHTGMIFP